MVSPITNVSATLCNPTHQTLIHLSRVDNSLIPYTLSPLVLNVGFLTNYHQLRRRTAQYCVGASSRLVVLSQKAHIQYQRGYLIPYTLYLSLFTYWPKITELLRRTGMPGAVMVRMSTREYDSSISWNVNSSRRSTR